MWKPGSFRFPRQGPAHQLQAALGPLVVGVERQHIFQRDGFVVVSVHDARNPQPGGLVLFVLLDDFSKMLRALRGAAGLG